jgi:hypothetical protein
MSDGRVIMDKGLVMVLGMSIAYLASFVGLLLAWRYYKKYKKEGGEN